MRQYLESTELTDFRISLFIDEAVRRDEVSTLYLLGKAAGYVDMAFAQDSISKESAQELHSRINSYVDFISSVVSIP